MLSLSKRTDYALLALTYLARLDADLEVEQAVSRKAVNTREIAEKFGLPVELLAKILQQLTRAGLLLSTPGPTGGYHLARPAAAISVGTVVECIDGLPAIIQCLRPQNGDCEQFGKCTIRHPLAHINARVYQMLNDISIREIALSETEPKAYASTLPLIPVSERT
jgi:Rrf2 family protein